MPETVVDDLESVYIDEQHCNVFRTAASNSLDCMVQTIHEQGPVGQSGQRIVERIIDQLFLNFSLVCNVGLRTSHPGRLPALVKNGHSTSQHPPDGSIGLPDTVGCFQMF